MDNSWKCYRI